MEFFKENLMNLFVFRILLSVIFFISFLYIKKFINQIIFKNIKVWLNSNEMFDNVLLKNLNKPFNLFILVIGIYISLYILDLNLLLNNNIDKFIYVFFKTTLIFIFFWGIYGFIHPISLKLASNIDKDNKNFSSLINNIIKFSLFLIGGLLIIQNLGYSITSLLAGLGIGGIAIALASQETLSNFFSSIILFADSPFKIGDVVKFENIQGTVEHIGFRTTKIRTFDKSITTIPNKLFMNSHVENFSQRDKRRIYIEIGITYDTSCKNMNKYIDEIRNYISSNDDLDDEFYVYFDKYMDSSLNIMIYCFTKSNIWDDYLKIKHELNINIYNLADNLNINFAFPSKTIYFGENSSLDKIKNISKQI